MRLRAVVLTAAVVGAGYAVWRLPATRRFVATVREVIALGAVGVNIEDGS